MMTAYIICPLSGTSAKREKSGVTKGGEKIERGRRHEPCGASHIIKKKKYFTPCTTHSDISYYCSIKVSELIYIEKRLNLQQGGSAPL